MITTAILWGGLSFSICSFKKIETSSEPLGGESGEAPFLYSRSGFKTGGSFVVRAAYGVLFGITATSSVRVPGDTAVFPLKRLYKTCS